MTKRKMDEKEMKYPEYEALVHRIRSYGYTIRREFRGITMWWLNSHMHSHEKKETSETEPRGQLSNTIRIIANILRPAKEKDE